MMCSSRRNPRTTSWTNNGRKNGAVGYQTYRPIFLSNGRTATPTEWLFRIFFGFALCAVGIVAGVDRLLIFGGGAFALAANVENLSAVNVGPDFYPFDLQVSVQRILEHPSRGLEVA